MHNNYMVEVVYRVITNMLTRCGVLKYYIREKKKRDDFISYRRYTLQWIRKYFADGYGPEHIVASFVDNTLVWIKTDDWDDGHPQDWASIHNMMMEESIKIDYQKKARDLEMNELV